MGHHVCCIWKLDMGNNNSKQVIIAGSSGGITDSRVTDAALNNVRLKMQD